MELIKLYTVNGPHYIDAAAWADTASNKLLAAYTKDGQRIHDLCTPHYLRMKAKNRLYGFIHRENLSTSKKEAVAKRDAIYRELFPTLY